MSDFIWVEKYRPQTIEDCILPDSIKKTFKDFLNTGEIPNMLLSGPPGVGKTTVAKALCNELGAEFYVINGSDEGRFLDTVRNNARNFASTVSLSSEAKRKRVDAWAAEHLASVRAEQLIPPFRFKEGIATAALPAAAAGTSTGALKKRPRGRASAQRA